MISNYARKIVRESLSLKIENVSLTQTESFDNLGFKLDSNVIFDPHIAKVVASCNRQIFFLSKIRRIIISRTAVLIFKAYIMSRLQYGLVFSLNANKKNAIRLQRLQNKALRVCLLADRYPSNWNLHMMAGGLPVVLRTQIELLMLMFNRLKSCVTSQTGITRNTRQSGAIMFQCTFPNTQKFLSSA